MKTLCFFNEKGGVGKTTHSVLFASYLAYHRKARVLVYDFEPEPRINRIRNSELKSLDDPSGVLSRYLLASGVPDACYDIRCPASGVDVSDEGFINGLTSGFQSLVDSGDYDYVIFDFPAGRQASSIVALCFSISFIDLCCIPVDTDSMTRRCGMFTADMARQNCVKPVLFWNNVSQAEIASKGLLKQGQEVYERFGFRFLNTKIKTFAKARRDSDSKLFVRSTLCFPMKYVNMYCPELVSLYEEILAEF